MNVLYHSSARKPDWEKKGLEYRSLHELLRFSDIISLHVPKNLVVLKEAEFDCIPPGSILIDTCLGVVFDVQAFFKWIKKKQNFAIFDYSKKSVFSDVTVPKNIIGLDDGIAGMTIEARTRLSKKVVDNIKSYLSVHV